MTVQQDLLRRIIDGFQGLWANSNWTILPLGVAIHQLWESSGPFGASLVCLVAIFARYRHLEQMEDKKNDHLERMEGKKTDEAERSRAFERERMNFNSGEAEKQRAFQRELLEGLLAHAKELRLPLAVKPTEHGVDFQLGVSVTDQAVQTTVRKTHKQCRERAPTNKKRAA